jgi:hypothetical protein
VSAAWIVVEEPAQIAAVPLTMAVGGWLMGTVWLELLLQPGTVAVIPMVTEPDAPAVYVIELVPAPAVIVPFVMLQT